MYVMNVARVSDGPIRCKIIMRYNHFRACKVFFKFNLLYVYAWTIIAGSFTALEPKVLKPLNLLRET